LGLSAEAGFPLIDKVDRAAAGAGVGFFAFGFRISRLLRFCPLATTISCVSDVYVTVGEKNWHSC
jgi:hypothetical protein